MVFDTLTHAASYQSLNSRFAMAFTFLRTVDGTQEPGRHELDGDRCFALVQSYDTKPQEKALFEAHRKYIDVQFVFSGQETILYAPLKSMQEETMPYTEEKDAALWKLTPDATPLHLGSGDFVILWPQDAHAPCVEWEKSQRVLKVVVKVAVE